VLQKSRRSPLARRIQPVLVVASFGLLAFLQLPSRAQEKKNEQSPQQQSVERDQAYVRQLLERGSSDAKVESFLKLSSKFASFNPSADFHAYALKLIAKEKTALKQTKLTKQTQQAAVRRAFLFLRPIAVFAGRVVGPSVIGLA
jgi:hypothetical protein